MQRRHFLEKSALILGASSLPSLYGTPESSDPASTRPNLVFTKFLEKLSPDELADRLATLSITGLEAPLRKGGHIEPEACAEKLPILVEALLKKNLTINIATSDVVEVDDKGKTEAYLRALVANGVTRYRLQHLKYDLSKPIPAQMAEIKAKLTDLAALNKELGIQGQYQNHRGKNLVGGPIWDMVEILKNIEPKHLGLAFDFAHATVEGSNTWELNFRRALPHIVSVYFKDYMLNGRNWIPCPLGKGTVNPRAGKLVSTLLPQETPTSLHIEYVDPKAADSIEKTLAAMATDLATLNKWLILA